MCKVCPEGRKQKVERGRGSQSGTATTQKDRRKKKKKEEVFRNRMNGVTDVSDCGRGG